ncbi:MAG: SusC/RagA family TonB-linked outer membrane protein, partial [Muribaculaceae bacterium]|nr:SusC/RagA family TonB-linked outer membrane protein [Muribaculaceae bacterium]
MNRKAWLTLIAVVCLAFPALAQKITVTGTVYEPEGEGAIGVSVSVQGQQGYGVMTDIDGNYRIEVTPNAVLVFSYVGYLTQEVPVKGRNHIDVTLVTNSELLDEVVVVGYGTVKKSDATGSVAVIKPDDIEAGLATSANDLLVGASPGVVVTTDGGNPSGGASIRIRGGASLTASNDPLVVIDGVPMNGSYGAMSPLTMLAPENIESMTILKDASATAIYGSRASNGVIIITTKKGQAGRPQVTFSANFHVATPARKWDVLDGSQFTEKIEEYANNDHALGLLGTANTDWQKEIYRTSFSQEYNVGVGGKVGFLPYRVNASYSGNNGIIKTSNVDRTTVGFNLTPKFFDGLLSVSANAKGTFINQRNPEMGAIYSALTFNPTLPVYTAYNTTGNLGAPIYGGYTSLINQDGNLETNGSLNPVAQLMGRKATEKVWASTGNLQIDYALHFLPDLHLNLNLGYDIIKGESHTDVYANTPQAWNGNYRNGAASYSYNTQLDRNTMLEFYANYKKEVESIKSNFDVMAGYTWQRFDYLKHNYDRITSIGYSKTY